MEDIIESFEKWWLNELDTYHQKGFWKKVRIDEARGTNIKDISINNMGIILKTLYSNIPKYEKLNWSIGHYFKIFHSRMKKMYIYAEQQFYKILYYTLENFGRRNIKETALRTTIHENVNYGNKNEIERSRKEMTKKHHIKIIDKF